MKSFLQMALLLVVLVGGVFALTFFTQFTRNPVEKSPDAVAAADVITGAPLKVPEQRAVWDPSDEDYAREFEVGSKGHYDFWVSNPHPKPVQATLETSSCVCSEIQIGILPSASRREFTNNVAALTTAFDLIGVPNLAAALAVSKLPAAVTWQTMIKASTAAPPNVAAIPPADPAVGPQLALVRMAFDGKEVKPLRLAAELRVLVEGGVAELVRFDVPTVIVPPLIIAPTTLHVGTLGPNDVREARIYVWSPIRPSIQIAAEEASQDPCIEVRPPRLLTPDELEKVPATLRLTGIAGNTRMKSGYEVVVAIHERRGDNQLELGPLSRKIGIRSPDWPETPIHITGVVRGNVRVGEGADLDRVNLTSFKTKDGTDKTVLVTSTEAGLDLMLKGKKPDFLTVSFEPNPSSPGLKQWRLRVEIEPNKHTGFLPPDSAIYLQTKTQPPRSIRIPVVGNATQ